jgi:hypothetical protein
MTCLKRLLARASQRVLLSQAVSHLHHDLHTRTSSWLKRFLFPPVSSYQHDVPCSPSIDGHLLSPTGRLRLDRDYLAFVSSQTRISGVQLTRILGTIDAVNVSPVSIWQMNRSTFVP